MPVAAVGVRERFHLSVLGVRETLPRRRQRWIAVGCDALMGLFGAGMAWWSWELVDMVANFRIPLLGISQGWTYVPMVVGGALMVLFAIEQVLRDILSRGRPREARRLRRLPGVTRHGIRIAADLPGLRRAVVAGVPVAFCLGIAAAAGFLYEGLNPAVVFQQMASGMSIFALLAIPFFIFAGEIMLHGGIARRLVALASRRGGLDARRARHGGCLHLDAVRRHLRLARSPTPRRRAPS